MAASVNLLDPAHVYLLDSGLLLWLAVIKGTTAATCEMIAMFPLLFPLLERGDEALLLGLKTIDGCLLLCGGALLQQHGTALAAAFVTLLPALPNEGVARMCSVVDNALMLFGVEALHLFVGVLTQAFFVVATKGEGNAAFTMYVSLAARALLINADAAFAIAAQLSTIHQQDIVSLFFMGVFDKFDGIIKEYAKKLVGLALMHVLAHPAVSTFLRQSFGDVVNILISLITVFHYRRGSFSEMDFFVRPASPANDVHSYQPEFDRRKHIGKPI